MRIENEFQVAAPIDQVWVYLLDVHRIAPCAPGAELTEVVDERTWKGKLNLKLGPIALAFAGTVVLQERDDQIHRAVLKADGREQKGKGAGSAVVTSTLESLDDGGTRVRIETDLTITGTIAQYGRGMMGDISQRLTGEFAQCLQANLESESSPSGDPAAASAQPAQAEATDPPARGADPVKGLRLGLWAFWRAVVRFFRRLFGRTTGS